MSDQVRVVLTGKRTWAEQLSQGREARGWSKQEAIEQLREVSDEALPATASMLRIWRRWESGETQPGTRYRRLLSKVFGEQLLYAPDTDDTAELIERIHRSEVDTVTLDRLGQAIDELCTAYSTRDPALLLVDAKAMFNRLEQLLNRRTSLEAHRRVLELAGWTAMLISSLSYDLHDAETTERARRTALKLGHESDSPTVRGWAHEIRAWVALTNHDWVSAIESARVGQLVRPAGPVDRSFGSAKTSPNLTQCRDFQPPRDASCWRG